MTKTDKPKADNTTMMTKTHRSSGGSFTNETIQPVSGSKPMKTNQPKANNTTLKDDNTTMKTETIKPL